MAQAVETIVAPARPAERVAIQAAQEMRRRLLRHPSALAGGAIFVFMVVVAVLADYLAPFHPYEGYTVRNSLHPPGSPFWLGTDDVGRDILSRMIHGARISLTVGLVVQTISITIGTTLGLIAGYFGRAIDDLVSAVTTVFMAFPSLLFAIVVMAVIGPSIFNVFLALGVVTWPAVCRLVRGEVLSLKEREFVLAAHAIGAPAARTMLRHLLPNCAGPIIVVATLGMAGAILAEASLSFLGLGVQPPTPSWGSMLAQGRDFMDQAWWMTTFPGAAIFVTILGLNLLGDGLRDVLDPRLRV
ncbi:MAG TPA: ABC transporter permease [Chloroflexota bacterium]|nr:ABC transporter permease [Chloroflexota bacterium]